MIIAVDFDGTIVEHRYPYIGEPIPGAIEALKELNARGHRLILFTMRCGAEIKEAVDYCKKNGVEFWAVNHNPDQSTWTDSVKVYAHRYIDDAAVGCPMYEDSHGTFHVDWKKILEEFQGK